MLNSGTLSLNQTNFISNSATTGLSGGGGAIYNQGGAITINTGTFDNNYTTAANGDGGAIFVQGSGSLNINDGTFTDNHTANLGSTEGGAIILIETSTLDIVNSTFERNVSPVGGAITIWSGTMTVSGSAFNSNTTSGNGGGIYARGPVTVSNSTFTSNRANQGGAISFNTAGSALTVTDSTFTSNTATHSGGGIFTQSASGQISTSTFSGNTANLGGGIDTTTGANSTVTNSTLYNNTGTTKGGAFYNFNGGTLTTINVTASGNTSAGGGGVYVESAAGAVLHMTNTILANSSGDDCVSTNSTLGTDINNLIETQTTCGSPVSSADPTLGALQNNGGNTETMALSAGSPAIDTGTNTNCPSTDQVGTSRPQGGTCDIGAYELTTTTLAASAACSGNNLVVNITAGDATFNISGTGTGLDSNGVAVGSTTLTGPGTWTGVTVTETTGDTESMSLGDFTCQTTTDSDKDDDDDGDDDDDDGPAPTPTPTPIAAAQSQEDVITCWPWEVVIPKATLPDSAGTFCQPSLGTELPSPSSFTYLGHVTDVEVKDNTGTLVTEFNPPIEVCFNYTATELTAVRDDVNNFLIQTFRDGVWESLSTSLDGYNRVCAPVDHLTLFGLFDTGGSSNSDDPLAQVKFLPETGYREPNTLWTIFVVGLSGVLVALVGATLWLHRQL